MIKLSADILYHLDILKIKKLDTFAGINIGPGLNFHDVTYGLTPPHTQCPICLSSLPFCRSKILY